MAGDHEVEVAFVILRNRWEENEFAVDSRNANACNRTLEGDVGNQQCCASGTDRENVRGTILIDGEGYGHDLNVVT